MTNDERLAWLQEMVPHPTLGMDFASSRWHSIAWDILGELEDTGEAFGGSSGEAADDAMSIVGEIFTDPNINDFASYRAKHPKEF